LTPEQGVKAMADLNYSGLALARRNYLIPVGHFVTHEAGTIRVG
jgi:hypothetical protein